MNLLGYTIKRPGRSSLAYLSVLVLSALFLWLGGGYVRERQYTFDAGEAAPVVSARVVQVWSKEVDYLYLDGQPVEQARIYFEAVITDTERKGERVWAEQIQDPLMAAQLREVSEGDRITLIRYQEPGRDRIWVLQEYNRLRPLAALTLVFVAMLLVFGGLRGISTLISLAFTCLAIFTVFIPAILAGFNIYAATFVICIYITLMTTVLVNGFNTKSLSASVGCLGGLVVAGIVTLIMDDALKLTGFVSDESAYLVYMNPASPMDLKAIIFSGILIGALGATLDVAVSMASSISELAAASREPKFSALLRSGLNIGRDIMGTMTNTLILAYMGGSLSMALLLMVYSNSLTELLNREMIVVEILQSVVGSMGLLCAIPLTALFASWIYTRTSTAKAFGEEETPR